MIGMVEQVMTASVAGDGGDPERRLKAVAELYSRGDKAAAEAAIAAHVAASIGAWNFADATFWQRVKFKARLLRAVRGAGAVRGAEGERSC